MMKFNILDIGSIICENKAIKNRYIIWITYNITIDFMGTSFKDKLNFNDI